MNWSNAPNFCRTMMRTLLSAASWMLMLGGLGTPYPTIAAPIQKAIFDGGASSTGWIDFDFQDGKRIFIPAKVNGHDTEVLLATGLPTPDIDRVFATSLGLPITKKTTGTDAEKTAAESTQGLRIQIGKLTLPNTSASVVDFGPLSKRLGHPLPILLGDAAFANLVVDIDFAHHRIAFSASTKQRKPADATEVPLVRAEGEHLVPVSIEGASPAQFELGLGNSDDMLVYQSYYDSHKLLEGRATSKRQAAGSGGFVVETVACLHEVTFAGLTFDDMPAAFIPASVAATTSDVIAGDIGLPVLTRFRLIIDYPHDRVYAIPYANAARTPLAKDRLGLTLEKEDAGFAVRFVAPNSPAEAAGFTVGDKVALIDGKPVSEWPETLVSDLRYRVSGTDLMFTMQDGGVRKVKLANYF